MGSGAVLIGGSRDRRLSGQGFTIVELLIVIIVIGILAAITIVAYNGIQGRAIVASLQSDLDSASKQLNLFQVDNSAYPTTIDCTQPDSATNKCIKSSANTTYQYLAPTNAQLFCLAATNSSYSYSVNQDNISLAGPCPVLSLDAGNSRSYSGAGSTWADLSGNGNNGTLVNGVSYTIDGGGSLDFNGVNGRVDLSASKLMGAGGVTMSVWYKTSSAKPYNFLIGKGNLSSGNPLSRVLGMQIYNSRLTFTVSQGNNTGWCSQMNNGPVLPTNGTWHQVTGTFDLASQTIKSYVDGVLQLTSTCNQTGDSEGSNVLYIGQDSTLWSSGYFLGQLNDVFVYNQALTSSDVLQNYNSTKARYGL